jgi:hypothetical protein
MAVHNIKGTVELIVADVRQRSLDSHTFYNHVLDGTLELFYMTMLLEVVCNLLVLPVERQFLGLEPVDSETDITEVTQAIRDISLLVSTWFLKEASLVERDMLKAIQTFSAEDIREARFLRLNQLLH